MIDVSRKIGFTGVLLLLLSSGSAEPSERRPNVLLVLADQWRAQALAHAGNPDVRTPALDTLAAEGIRFLNAISATPVCCPARASLLSGKYPLSHGVFMNDVPLRRGVLTLPEVLAAAGYDTGYIGKWHLDGRGRSKYTPAERRQGFAYWNALECTHDYSNSVYYAGSPKKLKWDGYDATAQTQAAEAYLRDPARKEKPFFLMLSWGPPHDPYHTAPREFQALYKPTTLKLRGNVPKRIEERTRRDLAGYYAHCSALDANFASLRKSLRTAGLEENTLLIFTSDHGDLLGAHGYRNKQQPYEESIRIPLLVRWPDGLGHSARELSAMVTLEDLTPTVLGLCGMAVPAGVEGRNLADYLRGGAEPVEDWVLISCLAPFGQWNRSMGGREYRGVVTQRHTFVRDLNGPWLLFDNQADPLQLTNLVNTSSSAELQQELDARLRQKLEQQNDRFRPAEYYLQQWGYTVDSTGTVPYEP